MSKLIELTIPVILASESSYKRSLLERLQIPFKVHAPYIDESLKENEMPREAALRLAKEKAESVAAHYSKKEHLVIGCDQIAYINDGKNHPFLGKPGTEQKARAQLQRSSTQLVSFYTAFHILSTLDNTKQYHCDLTEVKYRSLNDKDIDAYLQQEDVLNCAGSAKVEGLGIGLLEAVSSTDPSALIGLPLIQLSKALKSFN